MSDWQEYNERVREQREMSLNQLSSAQQALNAQNFGGQIITSSGTVRPLGERKLYDMQGRTRSMAIEEYDWQPNEHAWLNPRDWTWLVRELGDRRVIANPFNGALIVQIYVNGRAVIVSSSPGVPTESVEVRTVEL